MAGTGLQVVEPAGPYFSTCDMPEDMPEEEPAKDNSKRKWLMTTVLDLHTQHAHEAQWPSFLGAQKQKYYSQTMNWKYRERAGCVSAPLPFRNPIFLNWNSRETQDHPAGITDSGNWNSVAAEHL